MLRNMLPRLTSHDMSNVRCRDTKTLRKGSPAYTGISKTANLAYIICGQLRLPMSLASRFAQVKELCAAAFDHIPRVVLCRSVIQVLWVTALRVIASVAYTQAIRKGAVSSFGGDTMRMVPILANAESAISVLVSGAGIGPTGILPARHIYLLPEPVKVAGGESILPTFSDTGAHVATEPACCNPARLHIERFTALLTSAIWGTIGVHLMLLTSGAVPRTVPAVAGFSRASIIPNLPEVS